MNTRSFLKSLIAAPLAALGAIRAMKAKPEPMSVRVYDGVDTRYNVECFWSVTSSNTLVIDGDKLPFRLTGTTSKFPAIKRDHPSYVLTKSVRTYSLKDGAWVRTA